MNKFLLASVVALLGCINLAHGQGALGTPVTLDSIVETPPTYNVGGRPVCKPKPAHPVLAHFARPVTAPVRAVKNCLNPPACPDTPTKDDVARMVAIGDFSQAELAAAKIKIDEAQAN